MNQSTEEWDASGATGVEILAKRFDKTPKDKATIGPVLKHSPSEAVATIHQPRKTLGRRLIGSHSANFYFKGARTDEV